MYRFPVPTKSTMVSRTAAAARRFPPSNRRWLSGKTTTTTSTTTSATTASNAAPRNPSGGMEFRNAAERHEYLKAANAEMERYHHASQMMRQGKLKSKSSSSSSSSSGSESGKLNTGAIQIGVVTIFLMAFMATPLLGKRIAQDEEFRKNYIPSWYDFTVPKPDKPWTREELHEQMVAVQRELRERAIRGEFAPEKLEALQKNLELQYTSHLNKSNKSAVRQEWERIHPGVEDGEEVHED